MANRNVADTLPTALIQFAIRMLPEHRREWAEAALNEVAYIGARRAALSWALGCMFFALEVVTSVGYGTGSAMVISVAVAANSVR